MRILDRYIRGSVIWATSLVVLVLIGIESFIEFIGELSSIGVGQYGVLSVFTYVGMQLPSDIYQFFPVGGFLGGVIGLGRLASTSELIVMRAAGISISRIVWSVIKAALLMLVIITLIGEWLAPTWQYQAVQFKEKKMSRKIDPWASRAIWLHEGQAFVRIGKVISNKEIQDVERFEFDKDNHLISAAMADRGVLQDKTWHLFNVAITRLTSKNAEVKSYDEFTLALGSFQPNMLFQVSQKDPSQQTIAELWKNIQYRQRAGLLANELESAFWARVLQPVTTIVMICLGVPFIFGSLRSASMSARILTGIIVGFVFYMINQFIGPMALVYQWPAWLAGALPTMLFLVIYAFLLVRIRK